MTFQLLEASQETGIDILGALKDMIEKTGFAAFDKWQYPVMLVIACVLIYLAVGKKYEPLLLLPIAFGMLLANLPFGGIMDPPSDANGNVGGLLYYLHLGVELKIFPCLIFMAVGAMTDFGPMIANPISLLLGAAAQGGIFLVFILARLIGFSNLDAACMAIIGGADGPTAIYVTVMLNPELLPAIAIAAYSYMALIPLIQPPLMKLCTTKAERRIEMKQLREVSKTEKIVFPVAVSLLVILLIPDTAPLIGSLMFGNLIRECGVTERLSKTLQNELCNIVTVMLGLSVGAMASGTNFLQLRTLEIIVMGLCAFCFATVCGLLGGKLLCKLTRGKINPLIGAAGVSAVPMAARVCQKVGQQENPRNFLLMHAMGPNVAGVIGSAVAAGVLLSLFA